MAGALAIAAAVVWASLAGIGSLIDAILIALGALWMIVGPIQFAKLLVFTLVVALVVVAVVVGAAAMLEDGFAAWSTEPHKADGPADEGEGLFPEVGEKAAKFAIFGGMALIGMVAWLFIVACQRKSR